MKKSKLTAVVFCLLVLLTGCLGTHSETPGTYHSQIPKSYVNGDEVTFRCVKIIDTNAEVFEDHGVFRFINLTGAFSARSIDWSTSRLWTLYMHIPSYASLDDRTFYIYGAEACTE